jgi:hypothetical protein
MNRVSNYLFSRYIDEGETIVDVAHKHILVLKLDAAKSVFFGLIMPIFLMVIFPVYTFFFALWALGGVFAFLYHVYDWYYDAWILTDHGVVDVQRDGFFDFTSTRIDYHMIEGISYTIKGVLQTIFSYGDITIDKLGTNTRVILHKAKSPKHLERKVMKFQEKYVSDRSIRDHDALKGMLSEMIAYHVQSSKIKSK